MAASTRLSAPSLTFFPWTYCLATSKHRAVHRRVILACGDQQIDTGQFAAVIRIVMMEQASLAGLQKNLYPHCNYVCPVIWISVRGYLRVFEDAFSLFDAA